MSDTNFPDEQHKTAFKRLPQAQVLDGGGDWQIAVVGATAVWRCPRGIYEVFVALNDGQGIYLNHDGTPPFVLAYSGYLPIAGYWLPLMDFGSTVLGWASRPAAAGYDADVFDLLHVFAASRGWIVSGGENLEVISASVPWYVRFRRVG